jgi:hypothetical protein
VSAAGQRQAVGVLRSQDELMLLAKARHLDALTRQLLVCGAASAVISRGLYLQEMLQVLLLLLLCCCTAAVAAAVVVRSAI